jgi:L-cysteine S-thiosulfotransferase
MRLTGGLAAAVLALWASAAQPQTTTLLTPLQAPPATAWQRVGDAVPTPLTSQPGDPAAGRVIVASRQTGLCLLCHSGPLPEAPQQGNLAPSLAGAGSRWNAGQLRLRLIDARALNADSIMPPYFNPEGLQRVGTAWQGQPMLNAQQIEDVVAFLETLRD